ncbi:MAG: NDP-sugar synthase [Promethearchaeota archaeon]|nr:MAG: NDP-sugar synthase [Candidatus Lokiarchaeota archaeon]
MVNFSNENIPVVILAGGNATRLQPLSDSYPKALIPIAGKPLIGRILESFRKENFRNYIIVCTPNSTKLQSYVKKVSQADPKIKYTFVEQDEPKGMVYAMKCAKESTEKALLASVQQFQKNNLTPCFVVSAVDVLLDQPDLSEYIKTHVKTNPICSLAVYKSDDVTMSETHGNIKLNEGVVIDIIEKPGAKKKIDDYYSIPLYVFTQNVWEYIDKVELSSRQEFEIPSAIKLMLSDNLLIRGVHLCRKGKLTQHSAGKYHISYVKDILQATFRFLHEEPFEYTGEYPTIIEPVTAKSCEIGDSVLVGPKVYINEGCRIGDYSEISQCILLGNNKIGNYVQIENAILGLGVEIPDGSVVKDTLIMENNESHEI